MIHNWSVLIDKHFLVWNWSPSNHFPSSIGPPPSLHFSNNIFFNQLLVKNVPQHSAITKLVTQKKLGFQQTNLPPVYLQGVQFNWSPPKFCKYILLYNLWHLEKFSASLHGILYQENLWGLQLNWTPCTIMTPSNLSITK